MGFGYKLEMKVWQDLAIIYEYFSILQVRKFPAHFLIDEQASN